MTNPSSQRDPALWLGLSIAATVLCCLPLGIPGIVYAAKAMGSQSRGDHAVAQWEADKARTWTLWAIGVGLVFGLLYVCVLANGMQYS